MDIVAHATVASTIIVAQTYILGVIHTEPIMRLINRTSRFFMQYRSTLLRQENLTGIQYPYILRICEDPGITQDKLAELLLVDKSNVARQLAQLERNQYVTRISPETDRRQLQLYPTTLSEELYPKIKKIHRDWNEQLLEGFDAEERADLYGKMERIMRRAERIAEDIRSSCDEEEKR